MKVLLLGIIVEALWVTSIGGVSVTVDLRLTLAQKEKLDQFRDRVKPLLYTDYMKTDIYLIRWLRARNFNLDAAHKMLQENLIWRRENGIDKILLEDFEDIRRDFPFTVDTYDKEGRPIADIDISSWDFRAAAVQGRSPRLLRMLDFAMENVTTQVFQRQTQGLNVTQWKVVANAEGFNMINHACPLCIPIWVQFVSSLENHFGGYLDELIVVNAPQAVHFLLNVLTPLLSVQTRDAIRIFGTNENKWMAYLDHRISREERRAHLGGVKPSPVLGY